MSYLTKNGTGIVAMAAKAEMADPAMEAGA